MIAASVAYRDQVCRLEAPLLLSIEATELWTTVVLEGRVGRKPTSLDTNMSQKILGSEWRETR